MKVSEVDICNTSEHLEFGMEITPNQEYWSSECWSIERIIEKREEFFIDRSSIFPKSIFPNILILDIDTFSESALSLGIYLDDAIDLCVEPFHLIEAPCTRMGKGDDATLTFVCPKLPSIATMMVSELDKEFNHGFHILGTWALERMKHLFFDVFFFSTDFEDMGMEDEKSFLSTYHLEVVSNGMNMYPVFSSYHHSECFYEFPILFLISDNNVFWNILPVKKTLHHEESGSRTGRVRKSL